MSGLNRGHYLVILHYIYGKLNAETEIMTFVDRLLIDYYIAQWVKDIIRYLRSDYNPRCILST